MNWQQGYVVILIMAVIVMFFANSVAGFLAAVFALGLVVGNFCASTHYKELINKDEEKEE